MMNAKKKISIMVPTYNEEENVVPLSEAIIAEFEKSLPEYDYEIMFIDNCSTDNTRPLLRELTAQNPKIKAIFNARNFGQFNSPYHGICQTDGDCTVTVCADFQDPIEVIPQLVRKWEKGHKVVCAVKSKSKENKLVRFLRTCYYKMICKMSSVQQIEHFTGFGLYDKSFVKVLRELDDPTPFLRGVIAELGFNMAFVEYTQAKRRAGKTHNNFKTLYDAAMQSFTIYTKTPLRLFTGFGMVLGVLSFLSAILFIILGASGAEIGAAWLLAPMGFFTAVNLVAVGILGEYVLTLRSKIIKRPLVIEEERLNFDLPAEAEAKAEVAPAETVAEREEAPVEAAADETPTETEEPSMAETEDEAEAPKEKAAPKKAAPKKTAKPAAKKTVKSAPKASAAKSAAAKKPANKKKA